MKKSNREATSRAVASVGEMISGVLNAAGESVNLTGEFFQSTTTPININSATNSLPMNMNSATNSLPINETTTINAPWDWNTLSDIAQQHALAPSTNMGSTQFPLSDRVEFLGKLESKTREELQKSVFDLLDNFYG